MRLLDFVPMSEVTLTTEHAHLFQTYPENAAVEKEAKAKKDEAEEQDSEPAEEQQEKGAKKKASAGNDWGFNLTR